MNNTLDIFEKQIQDFMVHDVLYEEISPKESYSFGILCDEETKQYCLEEIKMIEYWREVEEVLAGDRNNREIEVEIMY